MLYYREMYAVAFAGMTFVTTSCIRLGATVITLPKFDPMVFLETVQKYKVTYCPLVRNARSTTNSLRYQAAYRMVEVAGSSHHQLFGAPPRRVQI
jgi:hypothetical protein